MRIDQLISWLAAAGLIGGGIDLICGNRLGAGKWFEEGVRMMGALALSIVGIMSLAPVVVAVARPVAAPVCRLIGIDPSAVAAMLCTDMGGFGLAMGMADDPDAGRFAGVLLGSTLGCTFSFTIPVGFGLIEPAHRVHFVRGLLAGLVTLPLGALAGGLAAGFSVRLVLCNLAPAAIFALLIAYGLSRAPSRVMRLVFAFGKLINWVGIIGFAVGAVAALTGVTLLPGMQPVDEALTLVCSVTLVLAGILPFLHLVQRACGRGLAALAGRVGLRVLDVTGLLLSTASCVPVFASMKDMSARGMVLNTAWLTSACCLLGSQLGFVSAACPEMLTPFLVGKSVGGSAAAALALYLTRRGGAWCEQASC